MTALHAEFAGPALNTGGGLRVDGRPATRPMSADRPHRWWPRARPERTAPAAPSDPALRLPGRLVPDGVAVWDEPVPRDAVLAALLPLVAPAAAQSAADLARRVAERDAIGSTYLGEGVDLPHARLDGLEEPAFALGLTRGGVADAEGPTEVVWLLLLPPGGAGLATTALVARACRDVAFRAALREAAGTDDVRTALARWERAHEAPTDTWAP